MSIHTAVAPMDQQQDPPVNEREEALWCELMRVRQRLQQVERDNDLLREMIDLLKAKAKADAPQRTDDLRRCRCGCGTPLKLRQSYFATPACNGRWRTANQAGSQVRVATREHVND